MTPADIKNIREIAERNDVLELLAKSLAPSIYGHDHIKKALVLQLLVSRSLPGIIDRHIRKYQIDLKALFSPDSCAISNLNAWYYVGKSKFRQRRVPLQVFGIDTL